MQVFSPSLVPPVPPHPISTEKQDRIFRSNKNLKHKITHIIFNCENHEQTQHMELDNHGSTMGFSHKQVQREEDRGLFPPQSQAPIISFRDILSHSQPNNHPFNSPLF